METILQDMRGLPETMTNVMDLLREMDKKAYGKMEKLKAEEDQLLADLTEQTKTSKEFDESPFLERYNTIKEEQQEIAKTLDNKFKTATRIYKCLDTTINHFGRVIFIFMFIGSNHRRYANNMI